jgi:hypothetical protein
VQVVTVPPRTAGDLPPYHAIFEGWVAGAGGGFNYVATCRPGPVTVRMIQIGEPGEHLYLGVTADDVTVLYLDNATTGLVVTGTVTTSVRIFAYGPPVQHYRIEYDCSN